MRTRISAIIVTGAAAALAIGLSATSSSATTAKTWTITPGGASTAKSGKITLTDTTTGNAGTCKSSRLSGTVKSGSWLSGNGIGSVTSGAFRTCTGPERVAFTVTPRDLPWQLNFTSYDPSTGVTTGTISHIKVVVSGHPCSAVVNGASGTGSDGVVTATYTNSTAKLKILPTGGNLHFWDVSGCSGLLNSGDPATFSGAYTITPRQVITSP